MPQCEGCSVVFPYMTESHCNPCLKQLKPRTSLLFASQHCSCIILTYVDLPSGLTDNNIAGQIQENAKQFEA